jgi:hypothetical protein
MSVTLDQFVNDLKAFNVAYVDQFEDMVLEGAIDAKSNIQQRFQESGQDDMGGAFGDYTPYTKRLRGEKGLQTSFVDLTDTGDMWRSIGVVNKISSGAIASITLGPKNADALKKLNDNTIRFDKPILELSPIEEENFADVIDFKTQLLINQYLE